MASPPRPSPGEPVASAWGDFVHDVVVQARGVVVGAGGAVSPNTKLPLDSVVDGALAFVDLGTDQFLAPVDGIYQLVASVEAQGVANGAYFICHMYEATAGFTQYSTAFPTGGANAMRAQVVATLKATAGQRFHLQNASGSGATMKLLNATWRLIASEWALS